MEVSKSRHNWAISNLFCGTEAVLFYGPFILGLLISFVTFFGFVVDSGMPGVPKKYQHFIKNKTKVFCLIFILSCFE